MPWPTWKETSTRLNFVDLRTGRTGPLIENGHGFGGWFSWRSDGRRFATGGDDGFVRVRDWTTGQVITERHVAPIHISNVDYTGDGRRLMVVEQTGTTYAIDAETLQPDGPPIQVDGRPVNAYASPDNHTAVVFTFGRFSLVDLDNGRVLHEGDAPDVFTGEFSPDGRRLAVADSFGGVRVLDVETGEWLGPLRVGHPGEIFVVAYAPDGATFVTAAGGAIVFWDAATGAPLNRVFPGRPSDGRMTPTYLPDGHTVLIAVVVRGCLHDGHQARALGRGRLHHRRSQPHRSRVEQCLRRPPLPRDLPSQHRPRRTTSDVTPFRICRTLTDRSAPTIPPRGSDP